MSYLGTVTLSPLYTSTSCRQKYSTLPAGNMKCLHYTQCEIVLVSSNARPGEHSAEKVYTDSD